MAKTGFLYVCAAELKQDESGYQNGQYLGPSAVFNINVTSADVKDYGDNRVVETDTSVTGGTISLEINEMLNKLNAFLLGHKVDETTGVLVCNQEDIAPMVGIGAVGTSRRNKANKYITKVYKKAQFKEPNDENSTKQENTNFAHSTLEGNMFVPEDGVWKEQMEFDTLAEAKEWLNKKLAVVDTGAADLEENTDETTGETTGESTEGTTGENTEA